MNGKTSPQLWNIALPPKLWMASTSSPRYGATNSRNIGSEISGPLWLPRSLMTR